MNLLSRSLVAGVLVSLFSCSVNADSLTAAAERELQRLIDRDVETRQPTTAVPSSGSPTGQGKRRFLFVSGVLLSVIGTWALALNIRDKGGCDGDSWNYPPVGCVPHRSVPGIVASIGVGTLGVVLVKKYH